MPTELGTVVTKGVMCNVMALPVYATPSIAFVRVHVLSPPAAPRRALVLLLLLDL